MPPKTRASSVSSYEPPAPRRKQSGKSRSKANEGPIMAQTPSNRRSTRAASRAASLTPAPAATPAPRARGKPRKGTSPLPAVPTAQSQAYGAVGKAVLETQTNAMRDEAGLAEQFAAHRGQSAIVDDDEGDLAAPNQVQSAVGQRVNPSASSARAGSTAIESILRSSVRHQSAIPEESEDEEDADEQRIFNEIGSDPDSESRHSNRAGFRSPDSPTSVNSRMSYDPVSSIARPHLTTSVFRRTITRTETAAATGRIASAVRPPATAAEIQAARPWPLVVLLETIPRYISRQSDRYLFRPWSNLSQNIRRLYIGLLLGTILWAILALVLLPNTYKSESYFPSAAQTVVNGIRHRVSQARDAAVYDYNLNIRITRLEDQLDTLATVNKDYHKSIEELKQILPEHLIVQKDANTGEWEMPPNFWTAFQEKLRTDNKFGAVPSWEAFLANNRAQIDQLIMAKAESSATEALEAHEAAGHILNRESFIEIVSKIATELEGRVASHLIQYETETANHIREYVQEEMARTVNRLNHASHGSHYFDNKLVEGMAERERLQHAERNYFSASAGAVVNPYLTSPTHKKPQKSTSAHLYAFFVGRDPHPPAMALERWDEMTDCWCAAESTTAGKGKAQLGVIMPTPIQPNSITIEHIPATGTLDIKAAPREVEVWGYYPDLPSAPLGSSGSSPGYAHAGSLPKCSEPAPAPGYICLGTVKYDIHDLQYVQNFKLYAGWYTGGMTQNIVVRVLNNWGQDWTCLYRVRIHGREQLQITEEGA